MKHEIGFVQFYDGSAKEIVGPFDDAKDAHKEAHARNLALNVRTPGRGKWGWMVANWNEIPRTTDRKVSNP